ncbi:uncharacterized protein N7458_002766 [Penicillium daleae]|uniref:Uncharacterized protein n=1 Tax=Penicillium daleae TaxID=63821 RepID=A0AAD6G675_9EURO|nr:uncharacterized protein N7458_002766 [Penicillium daleae]KAJ5461214.1 hypothetical protein N7458_002766 [Penicillium daleae]
MYSGASSFLVGLASTKQDIDYSYKPGFAAAKFLYYLKDDPAKELAFMRIYRQIPTSGTEWLASSVRAAQAVPHINIKELTAFKSLLEQVCPVIPQLLGYQEDLQGNDSIVPGVFATSIV